MKSRRLVYKTLLAGFACSLLSLPVSATPSAYPEKPVKLVIGYPPGGLADNLARMLANGLSERLKQTFIVENKPGASGVIATALVARASPDGYTIFLGDTTLSSVSMKSSLTYDPVEDFEAVRLMVEVPTVLIANKDLPVATLSDFIKLAKESPGKLNYASYGTATSSNLNSVLLKNEAGIDVEHVMYKGSAPATIALRAGDVQVMFDTIASAYPHISAGVVKPLVVTSKNRIPLLGDVPTVAEAGFPNVRITSWMGVLAPKGTGKEKVQILSAAIEDVLKDPAVIKQIDQMGLIRGDSSMADYKELIKREIARTEKVVNESGITFD